MLLGGVAFGDIEKYQPVPQAALNNWGGPVQVWAAYHQEAWFRLGLAYLYKDHLLEAFNAFYFSITYNPAFLEAYQNLAYTAFRLGDFREAAIALSIAIEIDPENSEAHHLLGVIYTMYAMYENAVLELEKAAKINPNNPTIHFDLGFAREFNGSFDLAQQSYKKALSLNPDYPEAVERLDLLSQKIIERDELLKSQEVKKHVK